jgi:hypothetical protein
MSDDFVRQAVHKKNQGDDVWTKDGGIFFLHFSKGTTITRNVFSVLFKESATQVFLFSLAVTPNQETAKNRIKAIYSLFSGAPSMGVRTPRPAVIVFFSVSWHTDGLKNTLLHLRGQKDGRRRHPYPNRQSARKKKRKEQGGE